MQLRDVISTAHKTILGCIAACSLRPASLAETKLESGYPSIYSGSTLPVLFVPEVARFSAVAWRVAFRGSKFGHNFRSCTARGCGLIRRKRDDPHPRMPAASITFADPGQIDHVGMMGPWIRPHGHLHAKATAAEPHAVHGTGVQIIRNKFVVAFK